MDPSVLHKLTREQREACCLYFVQGMDQAEIAEMLGIRQPAVSRRLSRANEVLSASGFPPLKRRPAPSNSRHVHQLGEGLTAAL